MVATNSNSHLILPCVDKILLANNILTVKNKLSKLHQARLDFLTTIAKSRWRASQFTTFLANYLYIDTVIIYLPAINACVAFGS